MRPTGAEVGSQPARPRSHTVRERVMSARAREAATDTAVSKSSRGQAPLRVSRTSRWWERRVSSNWRTTSLPRRAEEAQWTWRRSSPGS